MPLTDEIKQAAEDLGKQLGADANVREYLRLTAQAEQDAELTALEAQFNQVYQDLMQRQQAGKTLEQSDLDEYYRLKRQLQSNPLLMAQDSQLGRVKTLFAQTAQSLTEALMIDYPTFVK